MKKFIVSLTILFCINIFAKEISTPFIHEVVPQEGLIINYDLQFSSHPQKMMCLFENFYKGFLFYIEDNVEKDSKLAFGDGTIIQEFYFTQNGETISKGNLSRLYQFHVDSVGHVTIEDTPNHIIKSYATCYYLPE